MIEMKNRLIQLLPDQYIKDDNGDLSCLLEVFSILFGELKTDIDQFNQEIFDIETCRPGFVAHLLSLIGYNFDPTLPVYEHRKFGRTYIKYLQRRGTIQSYKYIFARHGYQVDIIETRLLCVRYGRSVWTSSIWPGEFYSKGSFLVKCSKVIRNARKILEDVCPVGKKFWFFFQTGISCSAEQKTASSGEVKSVIFVNRNHVIRWGQFLWAGRWSYKNQVSAAAYPQKGIDGFAKRYAGGIWLRVLKAPVEKCVLWGGFRWGAAIWHRMEYSQNHLKIGYQSNRFYNYFSIPNPCKWGGFRWGAMKFPYLSAPLVSSECYTGLPTKIKGISENGYCFFSPKEGI